MSKDRGMRIANGITFGPFRLDLHNQCLWREADKIALRPKSFTVLQYLLEHHDQIVSKQKFLSAVWSDVRVSDDVVKGCIREIRKALGEKHDAPRFIETDQRRGYHFIGEITKFSQDEVDTNHLTIEMPRFAEIEQATAKARLQEMREKLRRQTKTG